MNDCMTFPDTMEEFMEQYKVVDTEHIYTNGSEFVPIFRMKQWFEHLPSEQPDASKYEYHYDHTDCIWYGDGSNKCPSTCSQYRDGWNDAMQYIFGNGKGYKPYRRDGHHE